MTKECIESIRRIMVPFIAKKLKEIDYEGLGESDAKEFTKDFNEILNLAAKALEQQSEDAISREDALMCMTGEYIADKEYKPEDIISKHIRRLRALPPVQPKMKVGHCKDCKYFEYDHFENMGGIPLITAHKVCKRHGLICKTDEDGYCHLWEHKAESEE